MSGGVLDELGYCAVDERIKKYQNFHAKKARITMRNVYCYLSSHQQKFRK